MYGKHFEQMYEGSMVGAGPHVFAVMGYIIAKQKPSREHGSVVELNPKLLAYILGAEHAEVEDAIETLCSPDPESRTPDEDGRRLVKLGQFSYRVVNGAKYRAIRDHDQRNEQVKLAMRRHRAKKNPPPTPFKGEARALAALERDDETGYNQVLEDHAPAPSTQLDPPNPEFPEKP